MDFTLLQALIVCPLVFLAGFVDAIAGGGGLIALPAYIMSGLPVHQAIGTNKLSGSLGTALTTYRYARKGFIPWKMVAGCVVMALLGASTGSSLALMVNERIFKIVMLFLLPATALYVLYGKGLNNVEKMQFSPRKTYAISMLISFLLGVYDGFYGPGTGTFLILLLTGWAHMGLNQANGLTKAINLTTNVTSLVVFLLHGKVIIALGLLAGAFSLAGNYVGSSFFTKGGAKIVRPLMITVIAIFFVKVLTEVF